MFRRRKPRWLLIGDGGHAKDIFWTMLWRGAAISTIDHHRDWFGLPEDWARIVIGINNPKVRAGVAEILNIRDDNWIHPTAILGPDVIVGAGSHINAGVTVTRTTIGEHTTVAPGVDIAGDVTIGNRVFLGIGARVVNFSVIPDDTFVKAGAVWSQR